MISMRYVTWSEHLLKTGTKIWYNFPSGILWCLVVAGLVYINEDHAKLLPNLICSLLRLLEEGFLKESKTKQNPTN